MPVDMQPGSVYLGRHEEVAGLPLVNSGKVRDIYRLDDQHLLFVTSDRISAFDVVMDQGVAHKGRVLTAVAAWWFGKTRDLIANHLVSTSVEDLPGADDEERERLRGRIMIVKRCRPTKVEWVVRAYITGSGWKEYRAKGTVCGIELPAGLEFCQRLPEPILTPTTKEEEKDRPLTPDEARALEPEVFDRAKSVALALFDRGTEVLARLGILLADTKFEFGVRDGELLLIDEALTPDSSRFWPEESYAVGKNQPSYDKQILRDHLETLDWNKQYPPPQLDEEILAKVSRGYLDVCELITGALPEGVER